MRLSSLVYFYRLRLRTRWVQELFAFVGIAVGVGLLFAAQVASTSLTGSVDEIVDSTVGNADVQLTQRSAEGFDERLLERVRALPGVEVAAPMLEVRANALGPGGSRAVSLLGADLSVAELHGPLLHRFRTAPLPSDRVIGMPRTVVTDLGLQVGERLRLQIGARTVQARLGIALTGAEVGPLAHSPLAVGALTYVQDLSAMHGQISRLLVKSVPGQEQRVERQLLELAGPTFHVRPADIDATVFRQAAEPTNRSTGLFATISALVGFLFAFNAMLLTLNDRRRLLTALRIDGYSPRSVLQVVLFDALILGIAASIAGLVVGDLLSRSLFGAKPGYLSFAFAVGEQRIVEWQSVAIAVAGGIGATLLAALLPLADLLRESGGPGVPTNTLRVGRVRPMLAAGLACLAATTAILTLAPGAAVAGIGVLVLALMLVLPAWISLVLAGAGRLLGSLRSAIPLISIGELRSMQARSVALAATGALAVFGSVAIQGARGDLQRGLDRSARDVSAPADVWAAPSGTPNMLATTPFTDGEAKMLAQLPEVRAVDRLRSSFLDIGNRRVWVMAQPLGSPHPFPGSQLVDGSSDEARERLRTTGWAIVSKGLAATRDVGIGDAFEIPAPRPLRVRVAALSTNVGWPPGAIVLNGEDYSHGWGDRTLSAYQVQLANGVTPGAGRDAVQRALGPDSGLLVETRSERVDRQRVASRQGLDRLDQLSTLVLVAAILAMAAAMGGMVWQRRERLASLKLDGFDDLAVWRALLLESGLLLGAGCLAGVLFGLYGQQLLDRALSSVTGFPVVHTVAAGIAVTSFILVTAVAVAIAALPGYLAARVPPAAALQE